MSDDGAIVEIRDTNGELEATDAATTAAPSKRKAKTQKRSTNGTGLSIERHFTEEGIDPFDTIEWELRSATIANEKGETVFEQTDVEIPKSWSQLATNVVVSKYFRGHIGTPERETSVRQLIGRVVGRIREWGEQGGYFATEEDARAYADELTYLLVHQKMAFNSPVWFNLGVADTPQQASACFINSVEDTMESIMDLAKTEAMLFKGGSGTGSNLSTIRSSKELLAGGGTASGPVSFMRGFDSFAGVVKSGGKTRRAAKMVILNVDHPDVIEFISCKAEEEKKAWSLIEEGYDGGFNVPGGAYDSVFFQNANHSVRVTDEFMQSVEIGGAWQTKSVTTGEPVETLQRGRRAAGDGRCGARLRRPGHPVRLDDQPLEPGQELGAYQLEQPVLRVHVPRRHGLQPGEPEPHDLRFNGEGQFNRSRTIAAPRVSRSSARRSSSTSPTTRRRRSSATVISTGRSASATRTSARC